MELPEYAVYKGEEIIAMGTRREIAEKLGVKITTVRFWSTPANRKRIANRKGGNSQGKLAIRIEDEL